MSLEWEQFQYILQSEKLESIIKNREFILSFLDQLYTSLKKLNTSNQCYENYPQIGPLLTQASTHQYIGYDPDITKLVLSCLLEYAKLDLNPTNNNATIPKSNLWCIIRLRRLINAVKKTTQSPPDVDVLITKISELLNDQISNNVVLNNKLLFACLGLVHEKKAFPIIESFVKLALPPQEDAIVDLINFNPPQRLLSNQFLSHLAIDDALHKHSIAYWSNDLRARLLLTYNELLDTEILDLIAIYIDSDQYESIHAMQHQINQYHLLKVAIASPILSEILMTKLASYVVLLLDWKVVRIMQIVYRILEAVSSCKIFSEFMPQNFYFLSNYIYSGPLDSIETRKNIVWCLSLASIRNVWPLIDTLVNWSQTSDLWTSKLEDILVYINWIICPTKDNRESQSFSDLKSWIQSSQGKGLFYNLASLWRKLFCGNAIILSLFVISILNHLHVDQQISLIQIIYFSPEKNYTTIANNNDEGDSKATIYILLDSLEELKTTIPATSSINIPHIINHIHVHLSNNDIV